MVPRPYPIHGPRAVMCLALLLGGASALDCHPTLPTPSDRISRVRLQTVATGLTAPVAMAFPPDGSGRLFVVDQIGLIRIIDSTGNLLPDPFLDLRDRMVDVGIDFGAGLVFDERGLLGLAFHPEYASNGRFFVFYTAPRGDDLPENYDSETHVSEFRVSPGDANRGDPLTERLLLRIGKPQFNHNGGHLEFGPDGYLYISTGDGGGANDADEGHHPEVGNGRDLATLLGKILRIDVDAGDPYAIPADNPFVGRPGALGEIWAYGLRNPYRLSFDSMGDHRLFAGDVGQNRVEEVDIIVRGGHYGWRIREGHDCFDPANPDAALPNCPTVDPVTGDALIAPILAYPHPGASAPITGLSAIGGHIYRGSAMPELVGDYVFADWSTSFLFADGALLAATETTSGKWALRALSIEGSANGRLGRFVLGVGRDAQGELYLLTSERTGPRGTTGRVDKIVPPAG